MIGLLCGAIMSCAITTYKISSKIEGLKEINYDIKYIKECMVSLREKAGVAPSELMVPISVQQGMETEKRKPIDRQVVYRQKTVTGSTIEPIRVLDEEIESSLAALLEKRLKFYDVRLERNANGPGAKMFEEITEPVPAEVPEDIQRP